jgi:hypothetical protein
MSFPCIIHSADLCELYEDVVESAPMISATEEVEAAANDLVGQYEEVDVVDDVMQHVDDVMQHVRREVMEHSEGVHPPDEVYPVAHGDPTPLLCRPVVVLRQALGGVPLHLARFFIDDVASIDFIVVAKRCFKGRDESRQGIVIFIVEGEIVRYEANGGGRDHLHRLDVVKHNLHLDVVGGGGVHVRRGTKVELRSVGDAPLQKKHSFFSFFMFIGPMFIF